MRSVRKRRFFGMCTRVDEEKWEDDGEDDYWEGAGGGGGGLSIGSELGSWNVGDETRRQRKAPRGRWRQVLFP